MNTNERVATLTQAFVEHFGALPSVQVRAPGRVDLMGSHTDYNDGYVLTMSLDRDTWIVARPRGDGRVVVRSLNLEGEGVFDLSAVTHDREAPWTNYVRGVAAVLKREGYRLSGFDGLVQSTISVSSGLSSSAALEVATALAFQAVGDWQIEPVRLAQLCQQAENEFVGVQCGILDQYSSVLGQAGCALLLDCRALTSAPVPIASGVQVMICDTRAKRELAGSEYRDRRGDCEEGVRRLREVYPGISALRDVRLEQFEAQAASLPQRVAARCRFILEENARVQRLATALAAGDEAAIQALTAASFAGARDLYEIVSPPMLAMIDAMLAGPGVIGARQAGAGFGGCMVAFVRSAETAAFVEHVAQAYRARTGVEPYIYVVLAAQGADGRRLPIGEPDQV